MLAAVTVVSVLFGRRVIATGLGSVDETSEVSSLIAGETIGTDRVRTPRRCTRIAPSA